VRYFTLEPTILDPWTTASTFFGIVLFGCLYISMGCFASALTRSQIIAAMNSFVIGLGLFLLSLRRLVPAPPADWAAKVFSYISLSEHMEDFARGFVDTRHVVFYVSLTVFFFDPDNSLFSYVKGLIKEYQLACPELDVEFVDYLNAPDRAAWIKAQYKILSTTDENFVLFDCNGKVQVVYERELSDYDLSGV